MKKYILLLFFAFTSLQAQYIMIQNQAYDTVFDTLTCEPIYSVYRMAGDFSTMGFSRNSITANPQISSRKQPSRKDYQKNKIYDRGHLAPVIDFTFDSIFQREVNFYTNVAPQHKNLNRGVWRDLEDFVHNTYIYDYETITVYTGVVYGYRKLGKLRVPLYWYKLMIKDGFEKAWLIPNVNPIYTSFASYEVPPQTVKNFIVQYGWHHF